MNYESVITFNPPSFPEVTVTLKRMSHGRRCEFNRQMAPARARNRQLMRRAEAAKANPEDADVAEIAEELQLIYQGDMVPAILRCFVDHIEGIEINGKSAGVAELLSDGPEKLPEEIAEEAQKHLGLSPAQKENFDSPTPSAQQADGTTETTIAPTASA